MKRFLMGVLLFWSAVSFAESPSPTPAPRPVGGPVPSSVIQEMKLFGCSMKAAELYYKPFGISDIHIYTLGLDLTDTGQKQTRLKQLYEKTTNQVGARAFELRQNKYLLCESVSVAGKKMNLPRYFVYEETGSPVGGLLPDQTGGWDYVDTTRMVIVYALISTVEGSQLSVRLSDKSYESQSEVKTSGVRKTIKQVKLGKTFTDESRQNGKVVSKSARLTVADNPYIQAYFELFQSEGGKLFTLRGMNHSGTPDRSWGGAGVTENDDEVTRPVTGFDDNGHAEVKHEVFGYAVSSTNSAQITSETTDSTWEKYELDSQRFKEYSAYAYNGVVDYRENGDSSLLDPEEACQVWGTLRTGIKSKFDRVGVRLTEAWIAAMDVNPLAYNLVKEVDWSIPAAPACPQ